MPTNTAKAPQQDERRWESTTMDLAMLTAPLPPIPWKHWRQ